MSCIPINDFSLITLCDATKAGKLYSIVPDSGAGDFDVVRASTATYLGSDGLLKTAANNEPRIEFNADGTYKGLLVEPAATNLVLRSEEFDDAVWTKGNTTITPNAAEAPNGTATAETMSVLDVNSFVAQNPMLTAGTYTFSVYVKLINQTTSNFMRLQAVVDSNTISQAFTPTTQWKRVIMTVNAAVNVAAVRIRGAGFVGTVAIWGAQLETGTVATSYIPTVASTVTKAADSISKTGISSLIGQTEGTIYAEVEINNLGITGNRWIANLTSGTANFVALSFQTNVLRAVVRAAGGTQFEVTTTALPIGSYKIVVTYKAAQLKLYVNGVLIGTNSNASVSFSTSLDRINLDNSVLSAFNFLDTIKAAALLPTALTEQQAIQLTS